MPGNTLRRSPGHFDRFTFFNLSGVPVQVLNFQLMGGNVPPLPPLPAGPVRDGEIWGFEAPAEGFTVDAFDVTVDAGGNVIQYHYGPMPCNTMICIELGLGQGYQQSAIIDADIHGYTTDVPPESSE